MNMANQLVECIKKKDFESAENCMFVGMQRYKDGNKTKYAFKDGSVLVFEPDQPVAVLESACK